MAGFSVLRVPPVYVLTAVATMVALHVWAPVLRILAPPWNLLGLLPIAGGIATVAWAGRAFRRHRTTAFPHREPSSLLTTGPFRFTRNPMYLSVTAGLAGLAMLLGTLTPWLPVVAFVWAIDLMVIRHEERMLSQAFGDAYAAYRAQVRRWL
jgi:protein-S-isoprenylcysteine O-methyltransferase Ste14